MNTNIVLAICLAVIFWILRKAYLSASESNRETIKEMVLGFLYANLAVVGFAISIALIVRLLGFE